MKRGHVQILEEYARRVGGHIHVRGADDVEVVVERVIKAGEVEARRDARWEPCDTWQFIRQRGPSVLETLEACMAAAERGEWRDYVAEQLIGTEMEVR